MISARQADGVTMSPRPGPGVKAYTPAARGVTPADLQQAEILGDEVRQFLEDVGVDRRDGLAVVELLVVPRDSGLDIRERHLGPRVAVRTHDRNVRHVLFVGPGHVSGLDHPAP